MLDALRLLGGFALWCFTLAVALVVLVAVMRFVMNLRRTRKILPGTYNPVPS